MRDGVDAPFMATRIKLDQRRLMLAVVDARGDESGGSFGVAQDQQVLYNSRVPVFAA